MMRRQIGQHSLRSSALPRAITADQLDERAKRQFAAADPLWLQHAKEPAAVQLGDRLVGQPAQPFARAARSLNIGISASARAFSSAKSGAGPLGDPSLRRASPPSFPGFPPGAHSTRCVGNDKDGVIAAGAGLVVVAGARRQSTLQDLAHRAWDCFGCARDDDEGECRDLHGRNGHAPRRPRGRVARMVSRPYQGAERARVSRLATLPVDLAGAGASSGAASGRSGRDLRQPRIPPARRPGFDRRLARFTSTGVATSARRARATPDVSAAAHLLRLENAREMALPAGISVTWTKAVGLDRDSDEFGLRSSATRRRCSTSPRPTRACGSTARSARSFGRRAERCERAALAIATALAVGAALADTPVPPPVAAVLDGRLAVGGGSLPVFVSQDWSQPLPAIRRVVIVVHGYERNAADYAQTVTAFGPPTRW